MNYSQTTEKIIANIGKGEIKPSLLLHSCCAPCSSYVLQYLAPYFDITVLYYNPNIYPQDEYLKRKAEQLRLIEELGGIKFADSDYESEKFYCAANGLENEREGGRRCGECFKLRLKKTAEEAERGGFSYFGTTLTVSPHKNAEAINAIGEKLEKEFAPAFLYSDFKKKDGYKQSVKLSEKYGLYRQNYCGCEYSLKK